MSDLTNNQGELLPLTTEEKTALSYHENVIEKGLETFIEVGQSLQYIRDNRLYRAEYKTFDEYMSERWHRTRAWASNMIKAVDTMETLTKMSTRVDSLPESEKVVRPLAKLKDNPELMAQAWIELTGKTKEEYEEGLRKSAQPTHKEVEEKVKEYEARIKELESKQTELFNEVGKSAIEKSNYETQLNELKASLKTKEDAIKTLNNTLNNYEDKATKLDATKQALTKKEQELDELIKNETNKQVKEKLLEEQQRLNEERQVISNKEFELNQLIKDAEKLKQEAELLKDETQKQIKSEKEKYDYFQEWICEFSLLNQHFRGGSNTLTKNIRVLRNLPDFSILSDEEKQIRLEDTQEDINNIQSLIEEHLNILNKLRETLNDVENQLFQSDNVIDIIAV